ncbi:MULTISPECIES: poly-beta-1,6-N-acetyl-D-glucosamine N-deacetylase PgaB [unclassified Halomonas]|uniref:poly-beta-1,6-N-acetyl-D-glucosamine N-deacetylase PgaB n=1 Tax=unclassified Halomonas TaxID=2609666 RepID=UPI0006DAB37D|nr:MULTISPECIES: poly-beta-1,6-N-acetyl-D-glucosamine N-deacetylase PgaB [unclassified Halomonas]KPQ24520.1 MAG: poly-beta-1,6-N-acetyl-D-glucosamine N-deacetylase PgaB [Halomonas sp. HL-93]SBR48390.1 biofilm PGA synthesis lipoprotein PgaB [Halomonas sp. HL-93]SNY96302.1 biofilm PGA synthesis lipoprotein PgaB [Halomonas sp. hl-4]
MTLWRIIVMGAVMIAMVGIQQAQAARTPNDYVVISYHDIVDTSVTPNLDIYPQTITRNRLVEHFNLIDVGGYNPVSLQQIIDAKAGKQPLPEKAVLLTFDDGYRSFYDIVFPLLKLYGFPAVQAVVGSWLDVPEGGRVPYGNTTLPRERFLSWEQVKTLDESPLVEIASHSYDLHYGVVGNPMGNEQAAAVTSTWNARNGYESETAYIERVRSDMARTQQRFQEQMGRSPRIMVWPYGAYSQATLDIAAEYGMDYTFSLLSAPNRLSDSMRTMNRYLIDQETSLQTIEEILSNRIWEPEKLRIVHVDLDYVYDPDPTQQAQNLDRLIERIAEYGVSTVYLQAFADPDGDGVADALYFPNRHLPVRADLFNRVAWQLKKRANVKVYAWMPVLSFDLGSGHRYVTDVTTGRESPDHYLRLSPYVESNRRIIREIYQDLGRLTKFDGLLFHDDAFFTDFEDANPEALAAYERASLPGDINAIRNDDDLMSTWARFKTEYLTDFTLELEQAANYYRQADNVVFTTARNLYAKTVMEPSSQQWFAQDPRDFATGYDYVAVMAMPYMEEAENPDAWLRSLAQRSLSQVSADQLVFELQAQNWHTQTPIPSEEIAQWVRVLREEGIKHIGYYPDDFHQNHPDINTMRPVFSIGRRFRAIQ